ncbi:hypothetical protein AC1031_009683 [Aphanomyces cochlioides]|nr:hypothetical protein AC1031_009683 [Aphanomyces cochlioides]
MAYMTEPLPGVIQRMNIPDWHSFQEYTQIMTTVFQSVYHKINSTSTVVLVQDASSNTFAVRYTLDLPYSIPDDQIQDYLLRLPGSMYHAAGVLSYLTKFLTSNVEPRATMKPWQICEHEYVAGIIFGEMCFWVEEIEPVSESTSPRYYAWVALYWFETPQFSWFKFVFRSLVTTYVLYVLWTRYYRHFRILVHNLRFVGFGQKYIHYQVVLGDPGYAVLTDPFVSLAMSQLQDLWAYALGCMYLSRTVWFAYLCMRCLSSLVKWRRWEASFAPVDPGFLAITAYVYGGPLTSFITMTPVVWIFRQLWDVLLPQAQKNEGIEGILGIILFALIMSSFPLVYSRGAVLWSHFRQRAPLERDIDNTGCAKDRRIKSGPELSRTAFGHPFYNDLKAVILLSLVMRKHHAACPSIGGSLHKLYCKNPRYRSMPLFSHRAADVFVVCYDADGRADKQVRLSLLSWLDRQPRDAQLEIPLCSRLHTTSVCRIDGKPCEGFNPSSSTGWCVHVGDSNCPWVM